VQKRNSIIQLPLTIGLGLSVAIHAAALYGGNRNTPATPLLESGHTVVQLTLVPSAAKAEPTIPDTIPEPVQELPEPKNEPEQTLPVKELPEPQPQPIAKPAPIQETRLDTPATEPSAPEQIASQTEDKGVTMDAAPATGIQPAYPRISQRRGEEGSVTLFIQILASGKAGRIDVLQSSGFHRLDDAAVEAAKAASYNPALQFGHPVDDETTLTFDFTLTHE